MISKKQQTLNEQDMSRIRRDTREQVEDNVVISLIITKEQRKKLAIHRAETGQSASSFIRELLDKNL